MQPDVERCLEAIGEGYRTVRINNLLAKGEVFRRVACDDDILAVVEGVLGHAIQVSVISAIQIHPGEDAQGLHTDDALYPLPRLIGNVDGRYPIKLLDDR